MDNEYQPPEKIAAPLVHVEQQRNGEMTTWTPSFAVAVDEAVEKVAQKNRFFREVMREDQHYGKIPGAGDKPVLLKPGAELLLSSMGLVAELTDEEPPIRDLQGLPENGGEMLVLYRRVCSIYRQTGPGQHDRMKVSQASGSCSSREKKYRYRDMQRLCPECGKPCIITGKAEYGGGFLCFGKKGGCGAKFQANDQRILKQNLGQIPNPEIPDNENTILKMADKRALVSATLLATGCSDIFTQDLLDDRDEIPPPQKTQRAAAAPPQAAAAQRTPEDYRLAAIRRIHALCGNGEQNNLGRKITDDERHELLAQRYAKRSLNDITYEQLMDFGKSIAIHETS